MPNRVVSTVAVRLIRSLAFFVPAGLGMKDASYLGFFAAIGVPDAANVGAAFMVLKRGQELLWVAVGSLLLLFDRSEAARRPADPAANHA